MSRPDLPDPVERACWCGSERATRCFDVHAFGDEFTWVRCEGCEVGMLWPPPTSEQLAKAYASAYYGGSRRKFVGPIAAMVGWFQQGRAGMVRKLVPSTGRVLDVGCGNAGFLEQLTPFGYAVEGTELSDASAARARDETGIRVHTGDLLDLDLPDASYDAVTLWHVFEHLAKPHDTLVRIRALLKPTGLLVMTMPNDQSIQSRLFGPHWFHLDPPRHLYGFGPRSLTRLLEIAGFEPVRHHTWSFEQNPYGVIQSVLNAAGCPRDRAYDLLKGLKRTGLGTILLDYALLGLLSGPGIAAATAESLVGRGATFTVIAKPNAA